MDEAASDLSGRVVSSLDGFQRRHRWAGFPLAVIYKFADDQGGYLTALITYYGFLSLFPLLLLLVTVLGFALHGDPHLQARLLNSALAQFPVIGSQLRENVHAHSGSGLALTVGIVGTLYGCLGAAQATQNALNRAWAVPRNERPNPIKSRLRSCCSWSCSAWACSSRPGCQACRPVRARSTPPSRAGCGSA